MLNSREIEMVAGLYYLRIMKQLKFEHTYAKDILSGDKTATFRVKDDKDIRAGDRVQVIDKVDGDRPTKWLIPGELLIDSVESIALEELTDKQMSKGESFKTIESMVQAFRRYYGEYIDRKTPVTVLNFTYRPYKSAEKYLKNTDGEGLATESAWLYADGGSRGNPGPSAAGFVVLSTDNILLHSGNKYIGITTNNQAEYHAVIIGMEWCAAQGIKHLDVRLDSMLVVNQLKGIFKVKNRDLWTLYERSRELSMKFESFRVTHVPRELNKLADKEVNKALDAVKGSDIVQ